MKSFINDRRHLAHIFVQALSISFIYDKKFSVKGFETHHTPVDLYLSLKLLPMLKMYIHISTTFSATVINKNVSLFYAVRYISFVTSFYCASCNKFLGTHSLECYRYCYLD